MGRIGFDLMTERRLRACHDAFGERGFRRIFTERELATTATSRNRFERLAARFAAKEAVMKVLGRRVDFRRIEIVGGGRARAEALLWGRDGVVAGRFDVSMSHQDGWCGAVCLGESRSGGEVGV